MRDVNDTVILGFGSWSDVNALPTLGYAQSLAPPAVTILTIPGVELRLPNNRLEFQVEKR